MHCRSINVLLFCFSFPASCLEMIAACLRLLFAEEDLLTLALCTCLVYDNTIRWLSKDNRDQKEALCFSLSC